ncbi:hypothetical protein H6F42_13880 [Pseudanabaena sp. FACHB-1998]|uniref:phycobilisome linker polypeptide n=1 Tax=Pseudanabaena sp. FACHB-1998 TaxID=2692858 RepID=UPI0016806E8B|nr:phycobilisome linker polypeptide [Pseudanabaena sp. FACHB-1998]MBD2178006.1 hypothetical protein [Pseudanabaena sp. FACHB-1998]
MKSLDNDTTSANLNADSSRRVTIEFTGGMQSGRMYQGNLQIVTVPYSSFTQKLKAIQKLGGKITNVSIHNFPLSYPALDSLPIILEPVIEPVSEVQEIIAAPELVLIKEISEAISDLETTAVSPESIVVKEETPEIITDLESDPVALDLEPLEPVVVTEEVIEVTSVSEPETIVVSLEPEAINEVEAVLESPPVETLETVSEILSEPISDVQEIITEPEVVAISVEIPEVIEVNLEPVVVTEELIEPIPEPVVVTETETTSGLELPVALPKAKKKQVATEAIAKTKKPRASTKSSQGFSKKAKTLEPDLVTNDEAIAQSHTKAESVLGEEVSVHVNNDSPEVPITVTEDTPESIAPESLPESETLLTESSVVEPLVNEVVSTPITVTASRKKKTAIATEVKPPKAKSSAKSSQSLEKKGKHQAEVDPPIDIASLETPMELISVDSVVQELIESQPVKIEPEIEVRHEDLVTTELTPEVAIEPDAIEPEVPDIAVAAVEESLSLPPSIEIEPDVSAVKTKKTKASTKSGGGFNKKKTKG